MVDLSQFWTVGGLAVVIMALVQAGKENILKPPEVQPWLPWIAAGLGIALALLVGYGLGNLKAPGDWVSTGLGGLLAGFTATGVYEGTVDKLKPRD